MTSNRDLRKYMDSEAVASAFGKIVSGRAGYKAVIEKRKDPTICPQCRINLTGDEKFCPECGARTGFKN
ncbi:hypothetical protein HYV49_04320 [Candidatus Pacearchaeota archaeon]|nr:hypothetical protein [Candidatus Pacearchaeota archaeon]